MRVRKFKSIFMTSILVLLSLAAIFPLICITVYLVRQGYQAINKDFFMQLPAPVGQLGGGMANALLGSFKMIGLAACMSIPLGILAGLFLSEFRKSKVANLLRFSIDILASMPSIVIGIFVYQIVVIPLKTFSALAGAIALAIIMVPIVVKTTFELCSLVPQHIREAGLALGLPRWRVLFQIVLRACTGPVITGVMLAIARASGETAPLLFTALNSQFWPHGLLEPTASLPVQIYTYAISPFDEWHRQAWAGALVLVALVLGLNILTRISMWKYSRR